MMQQNLKRLVLSARAALLALGALALFSVGASAQATQQVNLIATSAMKTVTLPNGTSITVPVWAFAEDLNSNNVIDGLEVATVPGPRITVAAGTTTLAIHLVNQLPEPVSIVIPGQQPSGTPVVLGGRITSLAPIANAGGGTADYSFGTAQSPLKPGTFLYQSGSHAAAQVQMGLYGAMTANAVDAVTTPAAAPAEAYAGLQYNSDALLLFSEIDVDLHNAVASGDFGPSGTVTSAINYGPTIFLINGESYAAGAVPAPGVLPPAIAAGSAGSLTLLRLLNAGLESHVVALAPPVRGPESTAAAGGATLLIVAEDGNPYGNSRAQSTVLLAAGKTHDAVWVPAAQGDFRVYDRSLSLQALNQPFGGMLATLRVDVVAGGPGTSTVTAAPDGFTTPEDTPTGGNVLANDTGAITAELYSAPLAGGLTLNGDGTFTYSPQLNFSGVDSFWYRAVNGADRSEPTLVTITVAPVQDVPTALPQSVGLTAGGSKPIALSGTDPDSDLLNVRIATLPAHGTLSIIDPVTSTRRNLAAADVYTAPGTPGTAIPASTVVYAPEPGVPYVGGDTFTFRVGDGVGGGVGNVSAPAAVALAVAAAPVATDPALTQAISVTVTGVDSEPPHAETPVGEYKWTLEEDRTYPVQPGVILPETLSVNFHRSYMPVVQSGDQSTQPMVDPAKRYFLSVLPSSGQYAMSGVPIAPGDTSAAVKVILGPTPTAQVRVFLYRDNSPLNNAFDTDETPLQGFTVMLDEAGGRYGISGGQMMQDAFGNPLGTTYKPCPSANPATPCESYEVDQLGQGFILSDAQGFATFENLRPGKYTVKVIPPGGQSWPQTSTIEGTKGVDAWVKANEPTFFQEFGPAGPHVEIGFVQPTNTLPVSGGRVVTGTITNLHQSRPPDVTMFSGAPFDYTRPWVALNEGVAGALRYVQPVNENGSFTINNVPPGSYTLAIFDSAVDIIFASKAVTVGNSNVVLGDIPVFSWFTRLYHYVFEDLNKNGTREGNEIGISDAAINTRFRDGSVYQASATDGSGFVPFEETFPFFAWQIAEVDFSRFRATGVTTVVDNGGNPALDVNWVAQVGAETDPMVLAPQPQTNVILWGSNEQVVFGGKARNETGPVLLEGFQGFIGLTNVFLWGKAPYDVPGSHGIDVDVAPLGDFPGTGDIDWNSNGKFDVDEFHGGVSGIVHYSVTRAENNARWGGAEPWEPGIAAVTVQLWDATRTQLLNEVTTDSWDDSIPTGCQGAVFSYLGVNRDCYDGLRNWNQVRPAVFDGGYAFFTMLQDGYDANNPNAAPTFDLPLAERGAEKPLPAGNYVVKVIVPPGYKLVMEEDKNVDFGEEYIPAQFYLTGYNLGVAADPGEAPPKERFPEDPLWAPFCVGDLHTVAPQLSLFPGVPAAYGGALMPKCDEKLVTVRDGANAAANFFLHTEAPVAGHITGFVLDDLSNEFDPNSPQFGEKYAPPFMPISIQDWTGREISRTYTDRYGVYNTLVPSTYTASSAMPSGMTPNMLIACINAPVKADGTPDAFYNKQYSQFCYTFQYMPGTTTYLDTPVLPTGAFAGPGQATVDAELPDKTPVIYSVTQGTDPAGLAGPYIISTTPAARTITLKSSGLTDVPNPAFDANLPDGAGNARNIQRDYGFGSVRGQMFLGDTEIPVTDANWTNDTITVVLPPQAQSGQLRVVRCNGASRPACLADDSLLTPSVMGVTLTVATQGYHNAHQPKMVAPGQSIQAAIDTAAPGDLILVAPGTYQEMVIMDRPVRLQGFGAPSTIINAVKAPAEKLQAWRNKVLGLVTANPSYLLDFQATQLAGALPPDQTGELLAPILGGEGAAVTVFARNLPLLTVTCPQVARPFPILDPNGLQAFGLQNESGQNRSKARIDGLSLTGSDQAAGIEVNANACNIEILNNRIFSNMGDFGSGVKIGHPGAVPELSDDNAHNDRAQVAYNHISQNASLDYSAGGAIAIGTGAWNYTVKNNFIAGNFTQGQGAGIAHIGLSDFGAIADNTIIFNEVFNQDLANSGGGIYIGGRPPAAGGQTPGAGDVTVSNNQIQGNAAIGDGGGVALAFVNGQAMNAAFTNLLGSPLAGAVQTALHAGRPTFRVQLFGNTVVNNAAGLAGGGIALQDAINVEMYHTTVAHNDSLGVAGAAFLNGPNQSAPQPAGIVSRSNTSQLPAGYSNPVIRNSIVWENRSFYFGPCPAVPDPNFPCTTNIGNPPQQSYGLLPRPASPYWEFGVLGSAGTLNVSYSLSTSFAGASGSNNSQQAADPNSDFPFVRSYDNGGRRQSIIFPDVASAIPVPAAFDEGGNFIRPMFGPLTLTRLDNGLPYGDYHVTGAGVLNGQALYAAQIPGADPTLYTTLANVPQALRTDVDGDSRTTTNVYPTRGADQAGAGAPPPPPPPGGVTVAVANPPAAVREPTSFGNGSNGIANMNFTITLTGPHASPITVTYATANGTAVGAPVRTVANVATTDYRSIPNAINTGSYTFPATGAATQTYTVTVQVYRNLLSDVANETLFLNISSADPAVTITSAQATGTITNR